jgi:glycosyltransferase involved in cell wall biosynthesis
MKLSVITVNLNNKEGLKKTIQSVISQSYSDYEYIVIDGNSTDGSVEIIKQFAEKISYWVSEPDKGIYNAMNKGILRAKGNYLLFLNSGDWLINDHILERVFNENFNEDIVYGNIIEIKDNKVIRQKTFPDRLSMFYFYMDSLPHQASFIKRKLFDDSLYNESYRIVSDWDFFIKKIIFENCTYKYLHFDIIYFDIVGQSATNDIHREERSLVFDKILPEKIQSDYKMMEYYKNLRLIFFINNYKYGKGLKKWLAYIIVKLIISYYVIFGDKNSNYYTLE